MTEPAKIKCDNAISILEGGNLLVPHRLIQRECVNENDGSPRAFVAIVNAGAIYGSFHLHLKCILGSISRRSIARIARENQHLEKVRQTQEICKSRVKPLALGK